VYHHTPDIGVLRPAEWCVLEYAAPDRNRGYVGVFSLHRSDAGVPAGEYILRPRGIERGKDYEVTLDNSGESYRVSGRELAGSGIPVRLDGSMISELVLYTAVP
jgi:hypothetical protein